MADAIERKLAAYEKWLRSNGVVFAENLHPRVGRYGTGVLFEQKDGEEGALLHLRALWLLSFPHF